MVGQAYPLQQLSDTQVDVFARQFTGQRQRHRDVVGDSFGRQQVEVLEDHADLLAKASQAVGIHGRHVLVVDNDLAATRGFEAVDQAQQCTFARAGVANQAENLAALNTQTGGVQRGDVLTGDPVGFMNVMELNHVANLVGRENRRSAVSRAGILACPYRGS